jgi:hypothetical protein
MNVGLSERIKGKFKEQAFTVGRRIDFYLTKNMPDLVLKYDLATKRDLIDVDKTMEKYEGDLDELDVWRENTKERMETATNRVERLETKYGLGKEGR